MCCYGYTFCDLSITQFELSISHCMTYIIHDMMWSFFTSCNHNLCCVIIVHSFWSPDVTKQGAPVRCWTILCYPWFRNCSPIRDTDWTYSRRYQKRWHWGEREKRETVMAPVLVHGMRVGTTPPSLSSKVTSNNIVCMSVCLSVSVCMYVCICVWLTCAVLKLLNSCFCITLFT